jgi:hypothetical protein
MNRRWLFGLSLTVAVLLSGCCGNETWLYAPFGPGTLCVDRCGGCGDCGSCSDCQGGECSSCLPGDRCSTSTCEGRAVHGGDCYDSCGGCGSCDGCDSCEPCHYPGPLQCVGNILRPIGVLLTPERWGCKGCGDVYWGDFHGDPPYCCDPCNQRGQYVGYGNCSSGCQDFGTCNSGCQDSGTCSSGCGDCGTPMSHQMSSQRASADESMSFDDRQYDQVVPLSTTDQRVTESVGPTKAPVRKKVPKKVTGPQATRPQYQQTPR